MDMDTTHWDGVENINKQMRNQRGYESKLAHLILCVPPNHDMYYKNRLIMLDHLSLH